MSEYWFPAFLTITVQIGWCHLVQIYGDDLNFAFLTISNQQTATFEGRSWLDNSGLLDFRAGLDPGVEKDVSVKSKTSAPVCVFTTNFGVQGIVGGPTIYKSEVTLGTLEGV